LRPESSQALHSAAKSDTPARRAPSPAASSALTSRSPTAGRCRRRIAAGRYPWLHANAAKGSKCAAHEAPRVEWLTSARLAIDIVGKLPFRARPGTAGRSLKALRSSHFAIEYLPL